MKKSFSVTDHLAKILLLFLVGGSIYYVSEMLIRGRSHWSMFILGGVCFLAIGSINNLIPWEMPIIYQMMIGGSIITALEFITGLIVNVWLHLNIWDYSDLPGNVAGQICPQFFLLWILVSLVAILLDDYLRCILFHEEEPQYILIPHI